MALTSYLIRRGATYYARLRVPADLVPVVGKRELQKSLKTRDPREAKRLVNVQIQAWHEMFDDLRRRADITEQDKAAATWWHYEETLERDEERRQAIPSEDDVQREAEAAVARVQERQRLTGKEVDIRDPLVALDFAVDAMLLKDRQAGPRSTDAEARRTKLAALRAHLAEGSTALVAHEVREFAARQGLEIPTSSEAFGSVARLMMRAEIEAIERTLERDAGDYTGVPRDPAVTPAQSEHRESGSGETVMSLFEEYARQRAESIKTDTLNQARRDVTLFAGHFGTDRPAAQITKKDVREWKALLLGYPVKAAETREFRGLSMKEIVAENEKLKKPTIKHGTINRHLTSLSGFCRWLVGHDYLQANPVADMTLAKSKVRSVRPFTEKELVELFRSPLFTGCRSGDDWKGIREPGNVIVRDHRFWVPLLMLFSGARLAEVGQLAVADIEQQQGVWVMRITDEGGEGKSVKRDASKRVIPIHSELVALGFISYVRDLKGRGHDQVFPDAKRNERGQMLADYSRAMGRYLEQIGVKTDSKLRLYSLRHTATDALRRAGYMDSEIGIILGHAQQGMTAGYGALPQGVLEKRKDMIDAITYPGLDLTHLR